MIPQEKEYVKPVVMECTVLETTTQKLVLIFALKLTQHLETLMVINVCQLVLKITSPKSIQTDAVWMCAKQALGATKLPESALQIHLMSALLIHGQIIPHIYVLMNVHQLPTTMGTI